MQPSRRYCLRASLGLLAFALAALPAPAETLTITSTPAGANVEIDGLKAGTTPYKTDFPGGYFHKTHTVFGSRLEHAMVLRISLEGYLAQQVTMTEGPFEWVAVTGRRHGNYFLLKSTEFHVKLEPASSSTPDRAGTVDRDGPIRAVPAAAFRAQDQPPEPQLGTVKIDSDPPGAEIYVDYSFVGQTPSTLRLASGSHRIELRLAGKKEWQRNLDIAKDSQVTLHPVLESSP